MDGEKKVGRISFMMAQPEMLLMRLKNIQNFRRLYINMGAQRSKQEKLKLL